MSDQKVTVQVRMNGIVHEYGVPADSALIPYLRKVTAVHGNPALHMCALVVTQVLAEAEASKLQETV